MTAVAASVGVIGQWSLMIERCVDGRPAVPASAGDRPDDAKGSGTEETRVDPGLFDARSDLLPAGLSPGDVSDLQLHVDRWCRPERVVAGGRRSGEEHSAEGRGGHKERVVRGPPGPIEGEVVGTAMRRRRTEVITSGHDDLGAPCGAGMRRAVELDPAPEPTRTEWVGWAHCAGDPIVAVEREPDLPDRVAAVCSRRSREGHEGRNRQCEGERERDNRATQRIPPR